MISNREVTHKKRRGIGVLNAFPEELQKNHSSYIKTSKIKLSKVSDVKEIEELKRQNIHTSKEKIKRKLNYLDDMSGEKFKIKSGSKLKSSRSKSKHKSRGHISGKKLVYDDLWMRKNLNRNRSYGYATV